MLSCATSSSAFSEHNLIAAPGGWKPSLGLCQVDGFPVDRFELLYDHKFSRVAHSLKKEIELVSPDTEVLLHRMDMQDPWDLEEV